MKIQALLIAGLIAIIPAFGFAQCGGCDNDSAKLVAKKQETKSIVQTALGSPDFSTLVAALKAGSLVEALSGKGPFTVFAPTNAAFAKLPKGTLATLLKPENKAMLQGILKYHVVSGAVYAKDVVKLSGANTLNGQRAAIKTSAKGVMIDGARVTTTDIKCSNGVIHVIDSVILPTDKNIVEVAAGAKTFNTLIAAAKAAGLADVLSNGGPFTVFAPTDKAFAALGKDTINSLLKPENKAKLAAILKYHVVSGRVFSPAAVKAGKAKTLQGTMIRIRVNDGVAMVNDSRLLSTDINASNGVIHVIDSVLLPKQSAKH